jgi:curved DNA-binding protein CbpA
VQGKTSAHPLAELIREISTAGLSGALRLSLQRVKVAIYFETGRLVLATSNLRAHRLREVAQRNGLTAAHLVEFPATLADRDLAAALVQRKLLRPETLSAMRANQVSEVLRLALLWTEGDWEFDPRVRLADDVAVEIDIARLLRECARHLPASFVASRLTRTNSTYSRADGPTENLLPSEGVILSRVSNRLTLSELAILGNCDEEESNRAVYALALSGLLQPSDWPSALALEITPVAAKPQTAARVETAAVLPNEVDQRAEVEAFLARRQGAKDHYEVLDIARLATNDEIKDAYHALARSFHPDRFHQSDPQLRSQVESAFARVAQAYEVLSDRARRAEYDSRRTNRPQAQSRQTTAAPATNGTKSPGKEAAGNRAATSFQHGLDSLKLNRIDEAIRFLAEAAMLSPLEARYRAHYGHALIRQANMRRVAETELQAALSIEPGNAAYRVMLAELYKALGLQRRAEGELARALAVDPNNRAGRSLLASLKRTK